MTASRMFRLGMICAIGGTGVGLFFSWSSGIALLMCSVAIGVAMLWFPKRLFVVSAGLIICVAIFCGAWFRAAERVLWWETLSPTSARLERALVVGLVEQKENTKQATLQPIACGASPCPSTFVLGSFPTFADIADGDILALSCALEKPERFTDDFDYPKVLAKDGIGFVCRFPKDWRKEGESGGLFASLVRTVRVSAERTIERVIPEPEAGLVLGLIVGGDGRLPKEIQDGFSKTGLSHIVAVSGYNVSIIAILCMNILIFCGLYRQKALWGALLGVFFFTVLVGAPASAVRAAIMVSVALLATRMGRMGHPINGILCAAAGMLFINPLLLRYDIGFQLSFAATLGIFLVTPFALLSICMGDIVATTLAAELFVLPIILFHFHALPILSPLVNLCVLPLVPLAMMLGSFAFLGATLVPPMGMVFGFPAFLVSHAIIAIIQFFAAQSFASISIDHFSLGMVILWYGIGFMALALLRRKFPTVAAFG